MELETFTFEVDADGIALAVFDVPGRSMNTLTIKAIKDIGAIAKEVKENADIKGLVIASGKDTGFCAGADLGELGAAAGAGLDDPNLTPEEKAALAFEQGFTLNRTFREVETCGKPVACALNGLALGGGLELALACHYRVAASDNPKIQFGLPEAKVGLLPGAGGTQRLPRLIGIQEALMLIVQGKSVHGTEKAVKLGFINEAVPGAETITAAKTWVKANPDAQAPWDVKGFRVPGGIVNQKEAPTQVLMVGNAMVHSQTSGNYPAQKNILSCVYEGIQLPIDAALRVESRYFVKTQQTPQAKAMIRSLFLSLQALSKGGNRPGNSPKFEIKKVGVLGAGLMGAGIAYVQAKAGIETVLIDRDIESAERGKNYSQKIVEKDLSRGRITQEKADALLGLIHPSIDYADLADCDMVVEAVFENEELKAQVTKKAEPYIREGGVFGSNTSTLPITELAKASERPDAYVGVHFFSPVERMGLVEIIAGEKTSEETLAKAVDYTLKIKKTPIIVNDSRGFYTSRCFGTYTQEGLEMLAEGYKPAIVENIGRQSGMPMGPLEVSDSVGLDTALKIGRAMAAAEGVNYNESPLGQIVAWIVEDEERVGRKAGKGFYDYDEKGKPQRIWPGLSQKIDVKIDECPPEMAAHLKERFLVRQAIEVARCFEEGVITDARDGDIGSILAWGFAPYSGGCVSYIDLYCGGTTAFVEKAQKFAEQYGERFAPGDMLLEMAKTNQSFYDRFPPSDIKA